MIHIFHVQMSQGDDILLFNNTVYEWHLNPAQTHSYQMDAWPFLNYIPAQSVARVRIEGLRCFY